MPPNGEWKLKGWSRERIYPPSTHESPEEIFDTLMAVLLKSVWLCMKYELAVMVDQKSGVIVNTSSMDALICSAGTAVYAAAKSGVIALSKSIAQEYGRDGIRSLALVIVSTRIIPNVGARAMNDLASPEMQTHH